MDQGVSILLSSINKNKWWTMWWITWQTPGTLHKTRTARESAHTWTKKPQNYSEGIFYIRAADISEQKKKTVVNFTDLTDYIL